MARMNPDVACVESESNAEKLLFLQLKRELPDDFIVYHSVAYWLSDGRAPRARKGEADFVILHRELGLLVIEVKGGGISFDPQTDQWKSNGRPIKDPFEQARRCAEDLQHAIDRTDILKSVRRFRCGAAVAFPQCSVAGTPLAAYRGKSRILSADDADVIREKIEEIMRAVRPSTDFRLTSGQVRRLCQEVLTRRFDLGLRLTGAISWEKQSLAMLAEDQSICLDFLELNRRCMVRGPAGTGKTVTAVEWARRRAQAGDRVLVVCYNLPLAKHLRAAMSSGGAPDANWFAGAYHELCEQWSKRAGLAFEPPADREEAPRFWDEKTTELLLRAADRVPDRFDALVVDEAQDMHPGWWRAMQSLLSDPENARIVIFCDPYQNIYRRVEEYPVQSPVFPLRTNCRNTPPISEFFMELVGGEERYSLMSGGGTDPQIRRYASPEQQRRQIDKDVAQLLKEGVEPAQIVILGTHRLENSSLAGAEEIGGRPIKTLTTLGGPASNALEYTTLHRYKGLERDIVLLCDVDGNPRSCTKRHVYVGASRAIHRLFLYVAEGLRLAELPAE